jgi:hypothetical protein
MAERSIEPSAPAARRSRRPLILGWGTTALAAMLIYWLTIQSPALQGLAAPVYIIALAPGILVTWQWFRPRQDSRRRGSERRRLFRRARNADRG